MAENFYTLITDIGHQKIGAATTGGAKVELKSMAFGDDQDAYYDPTKRLRLKERPITMSLLRNMSMTRWLMLKLIFLPMH